MRFYSEQHYLDLSKLEVRRALMRRARLYWLGRDLATLLRRLVGN